MAQPIHNLEQSRDELEAISDLLIEAYKLAKDQPNEDVQHAIGSALLSVGKAIAKRLEPDIVE